MPNHYVCRGNVSAKVDVLTLASGRVISAVILITTVVTTLLVSTLCIAQSQPQTPSNLPADSPAAPTSQATTTQATTMQANSVTVPAGVQLALVLTNPLASKTTHRGDMVHAAITAPVTVGDQVLIPAGTYVQGTVDKVKRNGNRAEMVVNSASFVFPNGYVAKIAAPLEVESGEGTAWRDPSSAAKAGAFLAPAIGLGIGAGIGSQIHSTESSTLGGTTIDIPTHEGLAIGSIVGGAVGAVASIAILLNSRHFFIDVGSPMETTLPQPLILSENQIADAIRWAQDHPNAAPMASPRPVPYPPYDRGMCYTPGTPGTSPTIIPGTPAVGDVPGTPATVIPGTPAIPGTAYPCP